MNVVSKGGNNEPPALKQWRMFCVQKYDDNTV